MSANGVFTKPLECLISFRISVTKVGRLMRCMWRSLCRGVSITCVSLCLSLTFVPVLLISVTEVGCMAQKHAARTGGTGPPAGRRGSRRQFAYKLTRFLALRTGPWQTWMWGHSTATRSSARGVGTPDGLRTAAGRNVAAASGFLPLT